MFGKNPIKAIPLGFVATFSTGSLLTIGLSQSVNAALEDSPKNTVDQVWQIVNNEFVDRSFNQVDWQKTRQELLNKKYANKEEAYKAIRQALKQLNDPYTRFLDPKEFEALTAETSGEVSGIGVRLEIDKQTNMLTVAEPIENSPAIKAGLKSGDRILKIEDKPTSLMTLEQASEAIRGEVGTEVSLQIKREGQEVFEVSIARAPIEMPSVSYKLQQEGQMRVGYIKLDEFSAHAAEQMQRAIEDLKNKQASGFVLDLRGNPGGLLFASVDIARMWMEKGTIVHTVDRKGGDREFSANHKALTNLPLVVLVDENSASASEILAGALKDNKRAMLVGTRTFGKGLVQSLHSLADGSGVAVTISRYYPPSRIDINHKGIAPDVTQDLSKEQILKLRANPSLLGTKEDPQYAKAIAVLENSSLTTSQKPNKPISIR